MSGSSSSCCLRESGGQQADSFTQRETADTSEFHRAAVIKYRNRNILSARVLVLVINLFVFIPVLYNFLIVAVTDDFSSLFSSKLFFYFAYIFFAILVVGWLQNASARWPGPKGAS